MCRPDDYPPYDPPVERFTKPVALWVPYFESTEVLLLGDEWPTYVVSKWERNQLGETRFTGETRTYLNAEQAQVDAEGEP